MNRSGFELLHHLIRQTAQIIVAIGLVGGFWQGRVTFVEFFGMGGALAGLHTVMVVTGRRQGDARQ